MPLLRKGGTSWGGSPCEGMVMGVVMFPQVFLPGDDPVLIGECRLSERIVIKQILCDA